MFFVRADVVKSTLRKVGQFLSACHQTPPSFFQTKEEFVRLFPLVSVALLLLAPRDLTIMAVQGSGHASPYASDSLSTTGVVTMVTRDGFYVQDPVGDGDD